MRCLLVVNANAGRFGDEATGRIARLLGRGCDLEVAVTSSTEQAAEVVGGVGARRLVLAGGDGTLHHGLNTLDRRQLLDAVEVGVVPLGTANALVRGMGLPTDVTAACSVARSGRAVPTDLLEGDGRVVVNDVHTGVGVLAQQRVTVAKRLVGAAAYPLVNLLTALRTDGWRVRVEVDGAVVVEGEPILAVGVGNTSVLGNGTPVWPDANPGDGILDVVAALAASRPKRIALAASLARGRHTDRADVRTARGREVRIVGGPGRHNADGETWPDVHDVTYRVRARAWRLVLPSATAT